MLLHIFKRERKREKKEDSAVLLTSISDRGEQLLSYNTSTREMHCYPKHCKGTKSQHTLWIKLLLELTGQLTLGSVSWGTKYSKVLQILLVKMHPITSLFKYELKMNSALTVEL